MGVYHASASALVRHEAEPADGAGNRAQAGAFASPRRSRARFAASSRPRSRPRSTPPRRPSRRYVLQTPRDKLVNYELRRKMRRVGVQVQHIGTQLCWQLFVDDPGHAARRRCAGARRRAGRTGEHATAGSAARTGGRRRSQMVVNFAFEPIDDEARDDGEDEDYKNGHDVHEDPGVGCIRPQEDGGGQTAWTTATPDVGHGAVLRRQQPGRGSADQDRDLLHGDGSEQFELTLTTSTSTTSQASTSTSNCCGARRRRAPTPRRPTKKRRRSTTRRSRSAAHRAYVKEVRERINMAEQRPQAPGRRPARGRTHGHLPPHDSRADRDQERARAAPDGGIDPFDLRRRQDALLRRAGMVDAAEAPAAAASARS